MVTQSNYQYIANLKIKRSRIWGAPQEDNDYSEAVVLWDQNIVVDFPTLEINSQSPVTIADDLGTVFSLTEVS